MTRSLRLKDCFAEKRSQWLFKKRMQKIDVCIIGAGPSGIAAAAALVKLNPGWRDHLSGVQTSVCSGAS